MRNKGSKGSKGSAQHLSREGDTPHLVMGCELNQTLRVWSSQSNKIWRTEFKIPMKHLSTTRHQQTSIETPSVTCCWSPPDVEKNLVRKASMQAKKTQSIEATIFQSRFPNFLVNMWIHMYNESLNKRIINISIGSWT